jgi:hypothetical protein
MWRSQCACTESLNRADNPKGVVQAVFTADDDLVARLAAGVYSAVMAQQWDRGRTQARSPVAGRGEWLPATRQLFHKGNSLHSEFDIAALFQILQQAANHFSRGADAARYALMGDLCQPHRHTGACRALLAF